MNIRLLNSHILPILIGVILGLELYTPSIAQAADFKLGKDLVKQNCFGSCHTNKFYSGPKSSMQSLTELRQQVKMCTQALGWNDAQIDAATAYINREFYQFK